MKYKDTITALSNLRQALRRAMSILRPPPAMTIAQWAGEYRYLSSEASEEHGKWHNERAPFLILPMELLSPQCETEIVIMCVSSQMGKTELCLNMIGYIIHIDPGPTLCIQPTLRPMAEDFSRERIAPMLRDTPVLQDLVADAKSRTSGNTILHKRFPGGYLAMTGANSPAGLASRPIRYLILDELNRYPASAGAEGSPDKLAEKRTRRFRNRKILKVSSPTETDVGVDHEMKQCDTVYEWHLLCPKCGASQYPTWKHIHFDTRAGVKEDIAKTTRYECEHCRAQFGANEEGMLKESGQYVPSIKGSGRKVGFRFNQLASQFVSWEETVIEWLEAKDDTEDLKTFINTALAESFEDDKETLEDINLFARREPYAGKIPDPSIVVLTGGVDVQGDRLEMELIGHNRLGETWGIENFVLYGDPARAEIWDELEARIYAVYDHPSGGRLGVACTGIDSGYLTDTVYLFAKKHLNKKVFAMKGIAGETRAAITAPTAIKIGMRGQGRVKLFNVGVDQLKEQIYKNLAVTDPGPGYCHFPLEYPPEFFDQLTAEEMIKRKKRGSLFKEWRLRRGFERNEALDKRVYAFAALKILNPAWDMLENRYKTKKSDAEKEKKADNSRHNRKQTRKKRGFVTGYR
jgi:phage terminase large subunit GpA-like protein